jgi:WD40 repeat protein/DNA-binding SARP family transcriptional activator
LEPQGIHRPSKAFSDTIASERNESATKIGWSNTVRQMMQLEIKLLGTFQATIDGEVLTGFRSDKARALLAYLALERTRPHRRDWLATLLWGDYDDRSARRSLSSALANLRQLLAPLGPVVALDSNRSDIWLQASTEAIAVDAALFRSLLSDTTRHSHRSLIHCQNCIERLSQAADLYVGPFLPGLSFADSPSFDEWQRTQQEALHQQVLHALNALAAHHLAAGRYDRAEHYARRQLTLQPWHEEGHRQLMLALASAGQRNAALTQYDTCRAALAVDLGVEPEEQTTELYQRIRSGAALPVSTWPDARLTNPYRGLQSFRAADFADFYGRDTVTCQLVDAATRRSLAALIGPSGSGKSSVLHAGLIHHLRSASSADASLSGHAANGNSKPAAAWAICEVRPGSHPFHALAAGIAPHIKADNPMLPNGRVSGQLDLAELLAGGQISLAQLVSSDKPAVLTPRLLLVLDQFEELYTLCTDPLQRQAFVDLLVAASDSTTARGSLHTLLAVRADFMGQVLSHRALADALQDGVIMLGPMKRQELEEAIVKPAQAQGVHLQDGLAARILNDVGQAPGRLPLLQFALTQLWERRVDGVLTHEAYEAIGQVEGALASYAEQVFARLNPAQQAAARRVFTQMVQLGQDTDDTRRPITAAEVNAEEWTLLQQLADRRLVVTDFDPNGQQTAELAHEALIRGWGRLRNWINADRAFHLWQQRARQSADQWLASDRDPGALLRGAPLAEAEGWSTARSEEISPRVSQLIAASQAQSQQEEAEAEARRQRTLAQAEALIQAEHQRAEVEAKANRRLRWLAAILSVVTLLAALAGMWAVTQRNEAERQSMLAQAAQATADAERSIAQKEAILAQSRRLAAQSLNLVGSAPDLAILLALQAMRLNDSPQEDTDLLLQFQLSPLLGAVLHGQNSSVYSAAISPDSRLLASGGENGAIWLWDLTNYQLLAAPPTDAQQTVHSLAWSLDSTLLATGDRAGLIRLWDARRWQPIGEPISAHTTPVTALVFSSDGQTLYSANSYGTARAWNVETRMPLAWEQALAGPDGAMFNAGGSLIATSDGFTLTVQSALDGQLSGPPMTGHSGTIHDMAFSSDDSLLASASFDGTAMVWDVATGQPVHPSLAGHDGRVLAVAWSPDGAILATGGTDARIILWDIATGKPIGAPLLGHSNWVRALEWSPDGRTLISGDVVGRINVWDTSGVRWLPGHTDAVRRLAWSPDGRKLASGSFDQTVILRDAASGRALFPPLKGHENAVLNVAYSPDGSYLVSASAGGELVRWDPESGRQIGEPLRGHQGPTAGLAISPDSRTIASGSFDNTIILWDATSGQPLGEPLRGHENWVICLAWSPDGRTLASGSTDTAIRLWDVASGAPIGQPLDGHTGWVTDLTWSSDGATLISSSLDETVRFWDVATGRQAGLPFTGHQAPVWSIMFNPADGGRSLYTGDNNGTVIWWDLATRQVLAPPLRSGLETENMALSPDGSVLGIGSFGNDGLVSLWNLSLDPWEQRGCAIANRDLISEEQARYMEGIADMAVCPTP